MNKSKTWLEISLSRSHFHGDQSGPFFSKKQIIDQALACADEGATIISFSVFDSESGAVSSEVGVYMEIIEKIRRRVDCVVYPKLVFSNERSRECDQSRSVFSRIRKKLADSGLLEWGAINPASETICHYDQLRIDKPGVIQINYERDVRDFLRISKSAKLHPIYQILSPGALRLGASLNWREDSPISVYQLTFSSGYTASFPPEDYALTAYLNLIDQVAPGAPWMVCGLDADVRDMIPRIVSEGGHIRLGLEDLPIGSSGTNIDITKDARREIEASGSSLAEGEDVRNILGGIRKNPDLRLHL